MKAVAFIFARGGSKGLPGKNIRSLVGKPLIAWSIEHAFAVKGIDRVIITTDSEEIAKVARDYGAEAPFIRPAELAQDDSPEWLAWRHAIEWVRENIGDFECFVSLPATAPLRLPEDVAQCLRALENKTDVVVTMAPAQRSPWFNMVKADEQGRLSLLVETDHIVRRQDAPVGYDMTTVAYVLYPDFIIKHNRIWDGCVQGVLIPQERALDIDTEVDFKIAEFLMLERLTREGGTC